MNSYSVQEKVKIGRQDGLESINLQDTCVAEKTTWRKKDQKALLYFASAFTTGAKNGTSKIQEVFSSLFKDEFWQSQASVSWKYKLKLSSTSLATKQQREILELCSRHVKPVINGSCSIKYFATEAAVKE